MSTFAQLAEKNGVGVAYYCDVSLDAGATVSYRFGTHAGKLDGTNEYDARILSLGQLTRGLSVNGLAVSSVDVEIWNVDGGVDWMMTCDTSGVSSTLLLTRWTLVMVLFDPANVSDMATKTLGVFEPMEFPRRTPESVSMTLADRFMGQGAELAVTPTLRDIEADLYSWGVIPINDVDQCDIVADQDAPLPLSFGKNPVPAIRIARGSNGIIGFVVCCTCDTAVVTATELEWLGVVGTWKSYEQSARTGWTWSETMHNGEPWRFPDTVWSAVKSATVSKSGRSYKVVVALLDCNAWVNSGDLTDFSLQVPGASAFHPMPSTPGATWQPFCDGFFDSFQETLAGGGPLSSVNYISTKGEAPNATMVIYDLLANYSTGMSSSDINLAATKLVASRHPGAIAAGTVFAGQHRKGMPAEVAGGQLASVVGQIAGACGLDVIVEWGGTVKVVDINNQGSSGAVAGTLDETLISRIEDKVPSQGERWAPFNSLALIHGEQELPRVVTDTTWGWTLTKTVDVSWLEKPETAWIMGEAGRVRTVVTLTYQLQAILFELGDFVFASWDRPSVGGPYVSSIFRVEGLSLNTTSMDMVVTLVWWADWQTQEPYLLDDETLIVRVASGGGRTASVINGSSTVTFSSGSLVGDGVTAGDMLVLLDTTLGATEFTRFRAMRITSITDATHLVVAGSTAFGAAGATAVSAWTIVRGFTTYPTVISDPANYPDGSTFYGKVSDSTGVFSDSTDANVMTAG